MGKGIKGMSPDLVLIDETSGWDDPEHDVVGDIKAVVKRMREQPAVQYPIYMPAQYKEAYIRLYGEPAEGTVVWG